MKIFWFFGPSDPDHQREDLSGVLRGSRWALWSLLLTSVVFFTWAYFAEIDQITRAEHHSEHRLNTKPNTVQIRTTRRSPTPNTASEHKNSLITAQHMPNTGRTQAV